MSIKQLILFFFFMMPMQNFAQMDSSYRPDRKEWQWMASFSASFIGNTNWQGYTYNAINFNTSADIQYRKYESAREKSFIRIRNEVSYQQIADSLWIKSIDRLSAEAHFNTPSSTQISQCWDFVFITQWFNTYRYEWEGEEFVRRWSGGFMNPSTFEFAWGWSGLMLQQSRFSVSLATVRMSILPRNEAYLFPSANTSLMNNACSMVQSEYGFSARMMIRENYLQNKISWENDSRLFFNALHAGGVWFECNNRLLYRFLRFLHLRLESRIAYDPTRSLKIQYRQEFLLGVLFEHP